jgi:hypothetical protein
MGPLSFPEEGRVNRAALRAAPLALCLLALLDYFLHPSPSPLFFFALLFGTMASFELAKSPYVRTRQRLKAAVLFVYGVFFCVIAAVLGAFVSGVFTRMVADALGFGAKGDLILAATVALGVVALFLLDRRIRRIEEGIKKEK